MRVARTPARRRSRTHRSAAVTAATIAIATLAACSSPSTPAPDPTDGPATPGPSAVTLVVDLSLVGELKPLMAGFEEANPGVTLELRPVDYRSSTLPELIDELDAGVPMPDVVGFSDQDLGAVLARSEQLLDLATTPLADRASEFVPWAWAGAATADGALVAIPAMLAPQALCFRSDLLAEAGIAGDRDQLAALLAEDGGGWDRYFAVGRQYRAITGGAWFDQPQLIWEQMVRQLPVGYTDADGTLVAGSNAGLRTRWDTLTGAMGDGLSAGEAAWDWDDGEAFVDGSFATFPCTPWMTEVMRTNIVAAGGGPSTGWDVAPVLPGGHGSWGSSYLAGSATTEHPEAVAALLDWMTQPDRQAELAATPGSGLPSTRAGISTVVAAAQPDPFFGGAPLAAVFAAVVDDVPPHVQTPDEWWVGAQTFGSGLFHIEHGTATPGAAWEEAIAALPEAVATRP